MRNTRLFINGLSVATPLAVDTNSFWKGLIQKQRCFSLHRGPHKCDTQSYLAGRIRLSLLDEMVASLRSRGLLSSQMEVAEIYALYCAVKALEDAKIDWQSGLSATAVILGNLEPNSRVYSAESGEEIPAKLDAGYATYCSSLLSERVAKALGAQGPVMTVHNTCASGNAALELGAEMIRMGLVDTAIVGGVDAFSDRIFSGFSTLGVLGDEPCRPFERGRKYITISEGAGVAVLQSEAASTLREPYAELMASASSNDAKHPTNPSLAGVEACHRRLWSKAQVNPSEIDFVFAHGTGSRANDSVEATIFQEHYRKSAIYALKGTVGHLMGAAGALGLVTSCLTVQSRILPPNVSDAENLEYEIMLSPDALSRQNDKKPLLIQNNAFGFGGSNSICLLRSVL